MAVSSNELKKAMEALGISDIYIERDQAKKIYKQLLLKWHPDSCPDGEERFYTEISAKINSAYEILEQAYNEGLMGPNAKASYSDTYSYNSDKSSNNYSSSTSSDNNSSSNNSSFNNNSDAGSNSQNSYTSDTYGSSQKQSTKKDYYAASDYFDSPNGLDIIYYRSRWLNTIFLTICTIYIFKAILYSTKSDIYIEKSVINLISAIAIYYAVYWFCKCFWACDAGFILPGIISFVIYRVITKGSMYIYNKVGSRSEWFAMLFFIIVFFAAEYFIHIRNILLTFDKTVSVRKSTKILSYFMMIEYAIMLCFGLYSVIFVHKCETIRNTIIPPWY